MSETNISEFENSLAPEFIRSEAPSLNLLLLQNINRLNYIMSVARATQQSKESIVYQNQCLGAKFCLMGMEAMLFPVLSKEYLPRVAPIKERLAKLETSPEFDRWGSVEFMNELVKWYQFLMLETLPLGIYPNKKESFEFD